MLLQAACLLLLASAPALAREWQVGDKVQGYDVDWYDATILEVGTGDHAGEYLVKYDKYSTEKWLSAESVRARPDAPLDKGGGEKKFRRTIKLRKAGLVRRLSAGSASLRTGGRSGPPRRPQRRPGAPTAG